MVINSILKWVNNWPVIFKFLVWIVLTIVITYYFPVPVKVLWYFLLLAVYFFSRDESLWLAVFLATTDGFASFLGLYALMIPVLPGLPAVEVVQIYVMLSVIKAARRRYRSEVFYTKYLQVLLIYLIFMIIWGQLMGLSGGLNVYFRVLKGTFPMFLFYSIPRLMTTAEEYLRFFRIVFVIVLFAFAAQLFTLFTGMTPSETVGILPLDEEDAKDFRVFFNAGSTLLGLFGAIWCLGRRSIRPSYRTVLYFVVFSAFAMAILSATRGWILSFTLIIVLSLLFTGLVRANRILEFGLIIIPMLYLSLSNPLIRGQVEFARERLGTMEAIGEGDLTAEGTLQRLDVRSRRVMDAWRENPIFGWGLSDKGYEYGDGHVGNQCLLVMSGIVGFLLLNGFLIFFTYKLAMVYRMSGKKNADRRGLLVFLFFLAGWFLIHSTSGQQFSYVGMPGKIIPQTLFFSFGALQYKHFLNRVNGKKIRKSPAALS